MIKMELLILGQNIRDVRKTLKLSQEGLAEMAHLHRTYVCDVESGARNVSYCTLLRIARALRMTVSQLTQNIDVNPRLRMRASPASSRPAGQELSLMPDGRQMGLRAREARICRPRASLPDASA